MLNPGSCSHRTIGLQSSPGALIGSGASEVPGFPAPIDPHPNHYTMSQELRPNVPDGVQYLISDICRSGEPIPSNLWGSVLATLGPFNLTARRVGTIRDAIRRRDAVSPYCDVQAGHLVSVVALALEEQAACDLPYWYMVLWTLPAGGEA